MAIPAFTAFKQYSASGGTWLGSESQVEVSLNTDPLMETPSKLTQGAVFEVEDYSFDIEQTLNIGNQARGAGAGKVTFNPFSITRKTDKASPQFFQMACSGTPFETVVLFLRRRSAGAAAGSIFLRFDFKLVAVKTISYVHDDEAPKERVTFEYGGLQIRYAQQEPNGAPGPVTQGGWNRVKNVADTGSLPIPT